MRSGSGSRSKPLALVEKSELVKMKLFCLVLCDLPERDESGTQLQQDEDDHEAVGGPLHGQDDQVLVEEEEPLKR